MASTQEDNPHTIPTPTIITFPDGQKARMVEMSTHTEPIAILQQLGLVSADGKSELQAVNSVIIVFGGTQAFLPELQSRLAQLLSRGLSRAARTNTSLIVDGGIDAGVNTLLGKALAGQGAATPLLGVAPSGKVILPPNSPERDSEQITRYCLEPNHTHFVLVKSDKLGGEVPALYQLAQELSKKAKVITLLINGDEVAKDEVARSVQLGWPVIIVKGSDGLADAISKLVDDKHTYEVQQAALRRQAKNENKLLPPFKPFFIADVQLASIIEDGELHFFELEEGPERFERQLILQLGVGNILKQAEEARQLYSYNSKRSQYIFKRLQWWILALGVYATLLAILQTFTKETTNAAKTLWLPFVGNSNIQLQDFLFIILLSVPITISVLITITNQLNPGNKWVLLRATTESIKREVFRYRMRSGIYSEEQLIQTNNTRENRLASMLEAINQQWTQGDVNSTPLQEPGKREYVALHTQVKKRISASRKKPGQAAKSYKDDGLSFLTPNDYLALRLDDQLNFYRRRARELNQYLSILRFLTVALGGIGTLLAALKGELFITLTTALITAFTTYIEYMQLMNTVRQYNQAASSLNNIKGWWIALTADQQSDQDNIDKLVDFTETTLQTEAAGWVQQMQTALTDLKAQQAKQGASSVASQPFQPDEQQNTTEQPLERETENQQTQKQSGHTQTVSPVAEPGSEISPDPEVSPLVNKEKSPDSEVAAQTTNPTITVVPSSLTEPVAKPSTEQSNTPT